MNKFDALMPRFTRQLASCLATACLAWMLGAANMTGSATAQESSLTLEETPVPAGVEISGIQIEPVAIELKAGECSFHHPLMVHGSFANYTDRPRRATVAVGAP